jgi:putative sigma-54 modulation protein
MQISVTFRHMPASDPLKDHAAEKVLHIQKFLGDAADAHVVLSMDGHLHKADINLTSHGMLIRGEERSSDMYNSIDRSVAKIEKQIKRYRDRLVAHRPKEGARHKMKFNILEGGDRNSELATSTPPAIVETKEFHARPMMLDEAVMQMDLLHNDILVFLNAKTDQLNVLYRKAGNQYGLMEAGSV